MAGRDTRDNLSLSDEMNAKGIECADRGWLDEAANYFRKAIDLDPESGHAWDNLASVLAEKGAFREAMAAWLKSIELEPEVAAGHYNLANFLATRGLEVAESELKEALSLDPEYPDAHLSLGLVYADLGRSDESRKALESAIALDPEDAYPRQELAVLLMDENDIRGAISQLREVVRLEPENVEAKLDLGLCYARKGFYAEAERILGEAVALRPEDPHLHYGLATLHLQWKQPEDGLRHLRTALEKDREKVLGWIANDPLFDALRGSAELDHVLRDGD